MGTLILSNDDVEAVLSPEAAIDAVRAALRDLGLQRACNRARVRCDLPEGLFRSMTASVPALDAVGVKQGMWLASETDGVTRNVERRTELVTIYSIDEGRLLAVINSWRLNELRTAAAAAVAADCLARIDAQHVGVVGTGRHAFAQLEAIATVRPIETFAVYSRRQHNRERFLAAALERLSLAGNQASSAAEATADADIVIEATYSRDPVLTGEMIAPGAHVSSIGSSFGGKQVLANSLIERVSCFCIDFKEQSLHDGSGDILGPVRAGIISFPAILELGELVAGTRPGRTKSDEITLYKSLGMGLLDVAAGHAAYVLARDRGLGIDVPLSELSGS